VRAYIALGANLGRAAESVQSGARALAALPGTKLLHCSSLYRTAPVGNTAQPDFINAVCALETTLPATELMRALLEIERSHGRVRDLPGGPRTLDLDLLLYGETALHTAELTLPHPRLHERAFVLYPLQEIAPGLEIPGRGRIESLLPACAGQQIEKLPDRAG
jgi:2-amino-4-hydroxy-6-hydroxymethyldihydropteridine diphosphokinase